MITMVQNGEEYVPAFSAPEVVFDQSCLEDLRNALFDMLETCLADDDVKYCTPASSFYIVACMIRELTRDIDKAREKELRA